MLGTEYDPIESPITQVDIPDTVTHIGEGAFYYCTRLKEFVPPKNLEVVGDFAFAVMSNHLHRPTVGQQVSINYLNAPKGEKLTAKAFIKKNGRTSSIINVDISDDTGRAVAQFIGVGFKLDSK